MSEFEYVRLIFYILLFNNNHYAAEGFDPCDTKQILSDIELRLSNYNYGMEGPICDRFIDNRGEWFRTNGIHIINDQNDVEPFTCGTDYPVWMNGTLPIKDNEIVERTACVMVYGDICKHLLNIKIKKCGREHVYFLVPTPTCPAAYCFGKGDKVAAPAQKTAKPRVEFHFEKVSNFLQTYLIKCIFPPDGDPSLFYQIHWFIDDKRKKISRSVMYANITDAFLRDKDKVFKLGTSVSCVVRLKSSENGPPGPTSDKSDKVFGGIELPNTKYTVDRKGSLSASIVLKPTIPFGCPNPNNRCQMQIIMTVPYSRNECDVTVGNKRTTYDTIDQCGVNIISNKWNETHFLPIAGLDIPVYETAHPIQIIQLKVQPNFYPHPIWSDYELPPVQVHFIWNTTWTGKTCYAHSDPHMRTFDGLLYESQEFGIYILYQNIDTFGNVMQVEYKVTKCNRGHAKCICAIGIRAGGDVFAIDRCSHQNRILKFTSCKNDLLEVRKEEDMVYKAHFPTGTAVKVRLWTYSGVDVMEVDISPSESDIVVSGGLCGLLNGNKHDDYTKPDGKTDIVQNFIKSWKITNMEDSIIWPNTIKMQSLDSWRDGGVFCICQKNGDFNQESSCSPSSVLTCSRKGEPVKKPSCSLIKRRSVKRSFSYIPNNYIIPEHKEKRSAPVEVHFTTLEATRFCEDYMKKSPGYVACKAKVPALNPDVAIQNCVADIQLTNSTEWAAASREGLMSGCLKELDQNTTFQNISDGNGQSIAEEIRAISCPNDCSDHGVCSNGTCICDPDYIATDCSINKNIPPDVYGVNLEDGGLCDIQDCTFADVNGDWFIESSNLTCSMHYFEISYEGNVTYHTETFVKANHNTLADVQCPFPKTKHKRSTSSYFVQGFAVSVSNNKKDFSSSHLMYILDSTCQDTVNISGEIRFILRDGYCFINGRCYRNSARNSANPCEECQYTSNVFEWTPRIANECNKKETSYLWVIGAVLGGVALIVVSSIILWKMKMKGKRRIADANPPPYSNSSRKI